MEFLHKLTVRHNFSLYQLIAWFTILLAASIKCKLQVTAEQNYSTSTLSCMHCQRPTMERCHTKGTH